MSIDKFVEINEKLRANTHFGWLSIEQKNEYENDWRKVYLSFDELEQIFNSMKIETVSDKEKMLSEKLQAIANLCFSIVYRLNGYIPSDDEIELAEKILEIFKE